MGNRSNKQCYTRYMYYLNSTATKGRWTKGEDEVIIFCQKKYGNQWRKIARLLKGRSDNAVKNRWKLLHKGVKYDISPLTTGGRCNSKEIKRTIDNSQYLLTLQKEFEDKKQITTYLIDFPLIVANIQSDRIQDKCFDMIPFDSHHSSDCSTISDSSNQGLNFLSFAANEMIQRECTDDDAGNDVNVVIQDETETEIMNDVSDLDYKNCQENEPDLMILYYGHCEYDHTDY